MQITNIQVRDFLGIERADLALDRPVTVIAGPNGSGKSSLRDAIALALTGDLTRVKAKKDSGELVRTGTKVAQCEVTIHPDAVRFVSISASGKITDHLAKGVEPDPILPYVLEAQRFARLTDNERRTFLQGLMGVKTDPAAIKARLVTMGCDKARVERIAPMLRAGFDAACKDAKAKATEAKGAWRAITGETYGTEKAPIWRAEVPKVDEAQAKFLSTALAQSEHAMTEWAKKSGGLELDEQRRAALRAKLPALREQAARLPKIAAKLTLDEESLAGWADALAKTKAAAGTGPRVGLVHDLAGWLDKALVSDVMMTQADFEGAHATLKAYEAQYGKLGNTAGDPEARALLPEQQRAHDLLASSVSNDKRDLAATQQAKDEAARIDAELAETFDSAGLGEAREKVQEMQVERKALTEKLDAISATRRAAGLAEKRTGDAGVHAADVAAWSAIGDALAPDGIPAELLAAALGPINARLDQSSTDAQWPRVEITADMLIRTGVHERPYALLSESERWRCDAMIAEAIAHLSGTKLLLLDRFDVLDLAGRSDLLAWLDVLAETGEIDTALIFGTLKQLPTGLPDTIAACWIERGMVGQQLLEAA